MKIVSVILSVYIVILSTVAHCPDTCMTDTEFQVEQTDENSSHDCGDCCSPFMLCSSHAGFIIENFVCLFIKPQKISAEINDSLPFIYTSPFIGGIWQPPEIT